MIEESKGHPYGSTMPDFPSNSELGKSIHEADLSFHPVDTSTPGKRKNGRGTASQAASKKVLTPLASRVKALSTSYAKSFTNSRQEAKTDDVTKQKRAEKERLRRLLKKQQMTEKQKQEKMQLLEDTNKSSEVIAV